MSKLETLNARDVKGSVVDHYKFHSWIETTFKVPNQIKKSGHHLTISHRYNLLAVCSQKGVYFIKMSVIHEFLKIGKAGDIFEEKSYFFLRMKDPDYVQFFGSEKSFENMKEKIFISNKKKFYIFDVHSLHKPSFEEKISSPVKSFQFNLYTGYFMINFEKSNAKVYYVNNFDKVHQSEQNFQGMNDSCFFISSRDNAPHCNEYLFHADNKLGILRYGNNDVLSIPFNVTIKNISNIQNVQFLRENLYIFDCQLPTMKSVFNPFGAPDYRIGVIKFGENTSNIAAKIYLLDEVLPQSSVERKRFFFSHYFDEWKMSIVGSSSSRGTHRYQVIAEFPLKEILPLHFGNVPRQNEKDKSSFLNGMVVDYSFHWQIENLFNGTKNHPPMPLVIFLNNSGYLDCLSLVNKYLQQQPFFPSGYKHHELPKILKKIKSSRTSGYGLKNDDDDENTLLYTLVNSQIADDFVPKKTIEDEIDEDFFYEDFPPDFEEEVEEIDRFSTKLDQEERERRERKERREKYEKIKSEISEERDLISKNREFIGLFRKKIEEERQKELLDLDFEVIKGQIKRMFQLLKFSGDDMNLENFFPMYSDSLEEVNNKISSFGEAEVSIKKKLEKIEKGYKNFFEFKEFINKLEVAENFGESLQEIREVNEEKKREFEEKIGNSKKLENIFERIRTSKKSMENFKREKIETKYKLEKLEDELTEEQILKLEKKIDNLNNNYFNHKREIEDLQKEFEKIGNFVPQLKTFHLGELKKVLKKKKKSTLVDIFKEKNLFIADRTLDDYGGFGRLEQIHFHRETGCKIFKCKLLGNVSEDQFFCLKIFPFEKQSEKSLIQNEVLKLLKLRDNPNIISINCIFDFKENRKSFLGIEMDFIDRDLLCWLKDVKYDEGRDYFELLKSENKRNKEEIKEILKQLANGLSTIHAKRIIHRDLKHQNVMISSRNAQVKIIDFGIAKDEDYSNLFTTIGLRNFSTPRYKSNDENISTKSDCFSYGLILYECLIKADDIQKENYSSKEEIPIPEYLEKDEQDLLKKLLVFDPEKRISMQEVLNHKFFGYQKIRKIKKENLELSEKLKKRDKELESEKKKREETMSELMKEKKELDKTQTEFKKKEKEVKDLKESIIQKENEELCVVCLTNKANTAILPCGHKVLCEICCRTYDTQPVGVRLNKIDVCPVCRGPIRQIKRIY